MDNVSLPEITAAAWEPIDGLKPNPFNTRVHSDGQIAEIADSLRKVGWARPVLADEDGFLIYGHGTVQAAKRVGYTQALVCRTVNWSEDQKRFYMIADNATALMAEWDDEKLRDELKALHDAGMNLSGIGFSADELEDLLAREIKADRRGTPGSLAAKFGVPPFSVIIARDGWWQTRKAAWLDLGIKSEVGRG